MTSFYTSLNGLKNAQTELSVIANNLANAETSGFKKSRINFSDIVSSAASANPKLVKGIGSTVQAIDQNFSLGPIQQTGAALDLAIDGEGFFTKVSPITGKTFYTRNGNFGMDGGGYITDVQGNRLQVLPVDASGNVTSTTPQDAMAQATNAAGQPAQSAREKRGRPKPQAELRGKGRPVVLRQVIMEQHAHERLDNGRITHFSQRLHREFLHSLAVIAQC